MRNHVALTLFTCLVGTETVNAVPLLNKIEGEATHGSIVTLAGSGFGRKASPAPIIWEDCEQEGLNTEWSGAWPNRGSDEYRTQCRPPMRGISPPHEHSSMYVAGAHGDRDGADAGYNVLLYKNREINSYPAYTYASWYQRSDDGWEFCGDNNYKVFDFSMGGSPYTMPENWYIEYNPRPTSTSSRPSWHLLDDASGSGSSLTDPDAQGQSWWWRNAVNPMSGVWTKIEVQIRYSQNPDGYIRLWENGQLKIDYVGRTDGYAGRLRSEAIGGYARCYGNPSNWRYFSDIYLDYTPSRVVFANNPNLTQATIIEPQIPTNWSETSITVRVNLGRLSPSEAYAFVVDSSGTRNRTGVRVGSATVLPSAPTNVSVE